MPKRIEVIGKTFGRATVLGDGSLKASGRRTVECLCSCGTTFVCEPRDLMSGHVSSCGCLHRETVAKLARDMNTTHGMVGTPEYVAWVHIRGRCERPTDPKFSDYGGRGIQVCDRWKSSFEAFLADMGPRPADCTSIDRIDVNGNYEPENCRWATVLTQARNRRHHRMVEFSGQHMPLSQACAESGVNYRSALYRLNHGLGWQPLPSPPALQSHNEGRDGK